MPEYYCSKAPAKINLFLDILRKREDGYHEIRTIFQSIALFDTLRFTIIPKGVFLSSDDPSLPLDSANTVFKAANALLESSKQKKGIEIFIEKRIPQKGGMGGGSSDGACALYALNIIWELGLPPEELLAIAAEIGSDLPFFLTGGTAAGVGRGEEVYPLPDAPPAWLDLGFPEEGVSTREAYARAGTQLTGGASARRMMVAAAKVAEGSFTEDDLLNRFDSTVLESDNGILLYRDRLLEAGARKVMLSGSGSSWFAYTRSLDEAKSIHEKISQRSERWAIVPTLDRGGFFRSITPTSKKENLR